MRIWVEDMTEVLSDGHITMRPYDLTILTYCLHIYRFVHTFTGHERFGVHTLLGIPALL